MYICMLTYIYIYSHHLVKKIVCSLLQHNIVGEEGGNILCEGLFNVKFLNSSIEHHSSLDSVIITKKIFVILYDVITISSNRKHKVFIIQYYY